ncbi:hypothetical protein K8R66_00065 [bacterium]|nr:hypothetical protein [bacterium]
MNKNKLTILINKSIEEVFEFTTNPKNTSKWVDSIFEEKVDSLPVKIGSIYKNRGKNSKKWDEYEVIKLEKNKLFTIKDSDNNYYVEYTYRSINDKKTELTYLEWVEKGDLKDPFNQKTLQKLKTEIEKDLFLWRNQGGYLDIGEDKDDAIVDLMVIDDSMLCVTKKGIHSVHTADSIDPNRENPQIPNTKQKILNYGSDTFFVRRTILQARELFNQTYLPDNINCKKALSLALSFLKEITPIHESIEKYFIEEKKGITQFNGKTENDGSLKLPIVNNLDQQMKGFLISIDHAMSSIIDISKLFYPSIKNEKWNLKLLEELKKLKNKNKEIINFIESISLWIWLIRNLRNAIEHSQPDNKIIFSNYKLNSNGHVSPPTLLYKNKKIPLGETVVSKFMENVFEKLLMFFELLIAHLCSIHIQSFPGCRTQIVQIPFDKKTKKDCIRFKYETFADGEKNPIIE